jgi:hypothetical protein
VTRATLRRAGGLFLFLIMIPIATANGLPCAMFCLLESRLAHHHHQMDQHMAGHHAAGAKLSSPEHCTAPSLLVVAAIRPEFPAHPDVVLATSVVEPSSPHPLLSATPEFGTPPPRA